VPPGVLMASLALAADKPMERTARLATNSPAANKTANPAKKAAIIHIKDLEEDALPADGLRKSGCLRAGFAGLIGITKFSQAGTNSHS
jgi:hypothetical protein